MRRVWLGVALAVALGVCAPPAGASDPLFVFKAKEQPEPGLEFNSPCGLAVDTGARFYVADYYNHAINIYSSARTFQGRVTNVDPLDGPCALAVAQGGLIYANNYHRNVEKFLPSAFPPTKTTKFTSAGIFDSSNPTGVAVDVGSANVYVNARTHIAVYDQSGAPVLDEGLPLRIGLGEIAEGYGLALSSAPATDGLLYLADAATATVKVFNSNPALDTTNPVAEIDGSGTPAGEFASLRDSAIAVDDGDGEVYLTEALGPEFSESPEAAVRVFDSTHSYLGRLKYNLIDASPPGLAVDNSGKATQGRVYLTSGNGPGASVYAYPPEAAGSEEAPAPGGSASALLVGPPAPAPAAVGGGAGAPAESPRAHASEIVQKGKLRVTVSGSVSPKRLPRKGQAPVAVSIDGEISMTDKSLPPKLKTLRIELNRQGALDTTGLPTCPYERIQPASTQRALAACRPALVGTGSFTANIGLGAEEPIPTEGRMLLFNGARKGKRVLYGQIYIPRPFATSFVIVFEIQELPGRGTYGTALNAELPKELGRFGSLTGLQMTLKRSFTHKGKAHSFISAGCPAPKGFTQAIFALARTSFAFEGGARLTSTLTSTCKARG